MIKNRFWTQTRDSLAGIFTFKRVFYSFFPGCIFSWLTKSELTPFIFGGKLFSERSEWVQIVLVIFFAALYAVLLACLSHAIPLSFYLKLNAIFIEPIYAGCNDTLLELKDVLTNLRKPGRLSISVRKISELSDLYWIFGSYLAAYFLYFISPVFLNSRQKMWFSADYFALTPIGTDLRAFLFFSKVFFTNQGQFPPGNVYPPLFTLLMAPLDEIDPASIYKVMVPIILLSFLVITLVIPALIMRNNKKGFLLLVVFFMMGLFSHGLYFELERGQTNVIALLFVLTAIYLFHYKPRLRFPAYVLFSIGIQIKISPAIFILMFIADWKDWKTNIKRFAGIGIFNLALLFILGYQPVLSLLTNLQTVTLDNAKYIWVGNHSIMSFTMLLHDGYFGDFFSKHHLPNANIWTMENATKISIGMTLSILFCFLITIINSARRNMKGFNSELFVVSSLATLLIPAISNDYTLSILGSSVGIALATNLDADPSPNYRLLRHFLVSLITFVYTTVMYSYEYKPAQFRSNLPALMIMLFCFTIIALLPKPAANSSQEIVSQVENVS